MIHPGEKKQRRWYLLLLFLTFSCVAVYAQEIRTEELPAGTPIPISGLQATQAVRTEPVKGFSLERMAITGIGSLPFTIFYSNFAFDTARFIGNGFDLQYAPWPFKNQYSASVSTGDRFIRLGVSIGVSAVIGLLDALISRP